MCSTNDFFNIEFSSCFHDGSQSLNSILKKSFVEHKYYRLITKQTFLLDFCIELKVPVPDSTLSVSYPSIHIEVNLGYQGGDVTP